MLEVSYTCPCCLCTKEHLSDCTLKFPARDTCGQIFSLWNATAPQYRKIELYNKGFKEFPFWGWGLSRTNVYGLIAYDMLHIGDKTVCGDDLHGRCLAGALLGANTGLTKPLVKAHLRDIDELVMGLPSYQMTTQSHYTKHFYEGIKLGCKDDKWAPGRTISMEGKLNHNCFILL